MAPYRPPGRSNRSGRTQADNDIFEGLPVKQWTLAKSRVSLAPPVSEIVPEQGHDRWNVEPPMPRDYQLLQTWTQQLLRLARSGKVGQKRKARETTEANGDDGDARDEEGNNNDDTNGLSRVNLLDEERAFVAKKWKHVPEHSLVPEHLHWEYQAKRRKGLPSFYHGYEDGQVIPVPMRRTRVSKIIDAAAGEIAVYEVLAPEGQSIENEVVEGSELSSRESATVAAGTVIEGVGVANDDGVLVMEVRNAAAMAQRRNRPPPKKKGGPGRGKKRVTFTNPDGSTYTTIVPNATKIIPQPGQTVKHVAKGEEAARDITAEEAARMAKANAETGGETEGEAEGDDDGDEDGDEEDDGEEGEDDGEEGEAEDHEDGQAVNENVTIPEAATIQVEPMDEGADETSLLVPESEITTTAVESTAVEPTTDELIIGEPITDEQIPATIADEAVTNLDGTNEPPQQPEEHETTLEPEVSTTLDTDIVQPAPPVLPTNEIESGIVSTDTDIPMADADAADPAVEPATELTVNPAVETTLETIVDTHTDVDEATSIEQNTDATANTEEPRAPAEVEQPSDLPPTIEAGVSPIAPETEPLTPVQQPIEEPVPALEPIPEPVPGETVEEARIEIEKEAEQHPEQHPEQHTEPEPEQAPVLPETTSSVPASEEKAEERAAEP